MDIETVRSLLGLIAVAVVSAFLAYRYGKKRTHDDTRLQELTEIIKGLSDRIIEVRRELIRSQVLNDPDKCLTVPA